jgi:sterol desaturase/sphingolipid hydroxylase (fatty acid hydroxylase superfamily)
LQSGSILPILITPNSSIWTQIFYSLVFAFVWDVWQYFVHRFQHTNSLLWESHKFHHSETAMNVTSHARTHVLNHVVFTAFYLPMIMLIGSQGPHWIAALIMFRVWGYFLHSNIRLHFGPFAAVISGPQWHRIHHSACHQHIDKNFATFFPVIDIIFGTYYHPRYDEYPDTGLAGGSYTPFFYEATTEPFRALASRCLNRQAR